MLNLKIKQLLYATAQYLFYLLTMATCVVLPLFLMVILGLYLVVSAVHSDLPFLVMLFLLYTTMGVTFGCVAFYVGDVIPKVTTYLDKMFS